jgi:hypothetical protein
MSRRPPRLRLVLRDGDPERTVHWSILVDSADPEDELAAKETLRRKAVECGIPLAYITRETT